MYVERDVPSAPSVYFGQPAYFVSAPNRADDAALQAAPAGGRTLTSTKTYSFGRTAVFPDPQGAAFGVFEGETDP